MYGSYQHRTNLVEMMNGYLLADVPITVCAPTTTASH